MWSESKKFHCRNVLGLPNHRPSLGISFSCTRELYCISAEVVAVCDPMDRFERKLDLEMARMSTSGTGDIENQLQQFVHDNLRPNASFL